VSDDGDDVAIAAVSPPTGKDRKTSEKSSRHTPDLTAQTLIWDMSDFLKQCVDLYLQLAQKPATSLKKVKHPFCETLDTESVGAPNGELAPHASKILMKILYAARMARYDLLRAVCFLATRITKWTKACDQLLHRLVGYIHSSLDVHQVAWIADPPENLELVLYTDADFAGDKETMRSTSGVLLCLKGPNSFFPLSAMSKRQTCVSHSTPEAELVAADAGVRREGIPALAMWEVLLGKKMKVIFMEDNSAAIRGMETGKNPTMGHMSRTHGVSVKFLHECLTNGIMEVRHCDTLLMSADIFTKAFNNQDKWDHACHNIGVIPDGVMVPMTPAMMAAHVKATGKVDLRSLSRSLTDCDKRTLIEFCCGPDSVLGKPSSAAQGCEVIRLTEKEDVTTGRGLRIAAEACAFKPNVMLWASMPCTGGSPWQKLNARRPGVAAKIQRHIDLAQKIWKAFEVCAGIVLCWLEAATLASSGPAAAHTGLGTVCAPSLLEMALFGSTSTDVPWTSCPAFPVYQSRNLGVLPLPAPTWFPLDPCTVALAKTTILSMRHALAATPSRQRTILICLLGWFMHLSCIRLPVTAKRHSIVLWIVPYNSTPITV